MAKAKIAHYFLPSFANNQKARLLHPSFISFLVVFFLTSQFFLNYFSFTFPRVLGYASNISPEKVVELTNQKRAQLGLAPLKDDLSLDEAARRKAGDMFSVNYWSHTSPSGRTPWVFFNEVSYQYLYAGENLARDFDNTDEMVEAWMNSPTHRENIVNSVYKEIGVAVVNGTLQGVETTLVVQLFGTPVVQAIPSQQENNEEYVVIPLRIPLVGEALATAAARLSENMISGSQSEPVIKLSVFALTKTMVIFLMGLLLGALAIDVYWVWRKKLFRISGKSLAHLTFLVFMLLAVIITHPGLIL